MLLEVWGFCWLCYSWKSYLTDNGVGERGKWILWFSVCNLKMCFQQKRQQYGHAYCHTIWTWLCRRVVHFSKQIYHKIQKGTFWEGKWFTYKTFAHCKHVRYYCGMEFRGTGKGKVFPSYAWNNMEEWTCSFTHFQSRRLYHRGTSSGCPLSGRLCPGLIWMLWRRDKSLIRAGTRTTITLTYAA
jgi:hypothetical protein